MSKVQQELCNICLEQYNKKIAIDDIKYLTGNKIACIKCNYSTCTHCTKKYLLSSNNDAHCMSCKNPWDREFLMDNFTKVFVNKDYKKHRENILIDREKALLPATMKIIDRENKCEELREEQNRIRQELEEKLYEIDIKIWNLQNSSNKNKKERNKFIKNCPVEDCNGFLSSQWKCGICTTYTCKNCHEVIGKRRKLDDGSLSELPPHTCNEENVKTAMLLTKECKNCPKCAAPIYKIDGCNQMWCVECKTAFDWRTSEIITGHFHNPHYYEWVRQNNNGEVPREPGDNPCNQHIHITTLKRHIRKIIDENKFKNVGNSESLLYKQKYRLNYISTFFESLHRQCEHTTHIIIDDLNRINLLNDEEHLFNLNLAVRRSYLMGSITEEELKIDIQKKEKKRLKALDKKQIYQTFVTVCEDYFAKITNSDSIDNLLNCLNEIINFINHINKQLIKHKKTFNCVTYQFDLFKRQHREYRNYRDRNDNPLYVTVVIIDQFKNNNLVTLTNEEFIF